MAQSLHSIFWQNLTDYLFFSMNERKKKIKNFLELYIFHMERDRRKKMRKDKETWERNTKCL